MWVDGPCRTGTVLVYEGAPNGRIFSGSGRLSMTTRDHFYTRRPPFGLHQVGDKHVESTLCIAAPARDGANPSTPRRGFGISAKISSNAASLWIHRGRPSGHHHDWRRYRGRPCPPSRARPRCAFFGLSRRWLRKNEPVRPPWRVAGGQAALAIMARTVYGDL